jgi:hypothetical protein
MTKKILLVLLLPAAALAQSAGAALNEKDAAVHARWDDEKAAEAAPQTPLNTVRLLRARGALLLAAADYDTELSKAYGKFAEDLSAAARRAAVGGEARGRAAMQLRFVIDSVQQLDGMARQMAPLRTNPLLASDALAGAAAALNDRLSAIDRRRQAASMPPAEELDLGVERVQVMSAYFEINADLERSIAATYAAQASRRELLASREGTQTQIASQIDEARSAEWRKSLPGLVPEIWWTAEKLGDSAAEQRARTEANILLKQGKK